MRDQTFPGEPEPLGVDFSLIALPERLARLVHPDVLAARSRIIEERYRERGRESIYRRRYVEVIANHLIKALENARKA